MFNFVDLNNNVISIPGDNTSEYVTVESFIDTANYAIDSLLFCISLGYSRVNVNHEQCEVHLHTLQKIGRGNWRRGAELSTIDNKAREIGIISKFICDNPDYYQRYITLTDRLYQALRECLASPDAPVPRKTQPGAVLSPSGTYIDFNRVHSKIMSRTGTA